MPIFLHCCHHAACKAVDMICSITCHIKQAGVQSVLLDHVRCSESGVCCRYSAVINDNTITHLNVEPDGSGLSCSLADVVLKQLQEA